MSYRGNADEMLLQSREQHGAEEGVDGEQLLAAQAHFLHPEEHVNRGRELRECRLDEGVACRLELALLQEAQAVVVAAPHSTDKNRPENGHADGQRAGFADEVTTAGNVPFHAEAVEAEEALSEEVVGGVERGVGEIAEEVLG